MANDFSRFISHYRDRGGELPNATLSSIFHTARKILYERNEFSCIALSLAYSKYSLKYPDDILDAWKRVHGYQHWWDAPLTAENRELRKKALKEITYQSLYD
jgi:hypothetical protein